LLIFESERRVSGLLIRKNVSTEIRNWVDEKNEWNTLKDHEKIQNEYNSK